MIKRSLAFLFLLSLLSSMLVAEANSGLDAFLAKSFPDNGDLRSQYWTSLITAPRDQAWAFKERNLVSKSAGQVKLKATKRESDFIIQFINNSKGSFSDYSRGSFSIQKDSATGYFLQTKIFLQDDPGCYARLYPQGGGTAMDVVMYGAVIKKGLYISGLIYSILKRPFPEIISETRRSFDWCLVFGPDVSNGASAFARELRASYQAAGGDQAPSLAAGDKLPNRTIIQASMPSFGVISPGESLLPAPPPTSAQPSRPSLISGLISEASSCEALVQDLAAHGERCTELNTSSFLKVPALGTSNDGDPLVPGPPSRTFPKYEEGKGLPLANLKAAIFLDTLNSAQASVYALVGDTTRTLAVAYFDESGLFHFDVFGKDGELTWESAISPKDQKLRIFRLGA